ncbi:uncharacterized protein LOC141846958 [Curcuma longa]|uniref:uncharacterized protein LOC141846958 n=1 Tax=Curcuma longa TaxID=136217 RepID=UPI003D9F149E
MVAVRPVRPVAVQVTVPVSKPPPQNVVLRDGVTSDTPVSYICTGSFEILEWVGEVAYCLALPSTLVGVHSVFHVSMLRRYVPHPSHILREVPVHLQPDASYEEIPVRILNHKERRNKTIQLVKVG